MSTTVYPLTNGGPFDDEGPNFPDTTGRGMSTTNRLLESRGGIPTTKPRKSPKDLIREAEGVLNHRKPKVKTGGKPKNLRASSSKRKKGPFGEAYTAAPSGGNKGVRVAESRRRL